MSSKTEIANRALSKLGQPRVSNIDTVNIKSAQIIRNMWDMVRDEMLQAYPWNFAIARASLAKDASAPEWGYNNRYTLPSDFLSLLEIYNFPQYSIESGYILTNDGGPLKIRYIKRVENTGNFDPLFSAALASKIAFEACEELTQSNTKKEALFTEFEFNIKRAYANDAIQEYPQDLRPDTWLTAREASIAGDDIDYSSTGY